MALPLPGQCPPSTRAADDVLAELDAVVAQLQVHAPIVAALYERRDELYVEAREGLPTPIVQRVLAEHSGVEEVAVTASWRRIEKRRAKLAATAQEATP
jgi:hypothetical protein